MKIPKVFINSTSLTFSEITLSSAISNLYNSNVARLNSDSLADLAWTGSGSVKLRNNTNGLVLDSPVEVFTDTTWSDLRLLNTVDVDADGDQDLILELDHSPGYTILTFQNLGDGTFSDPDTLVSTSGFTGGLEFADLNNDGLIDLYYGHAELGTLERRVQYWRNSGNGNFVLQQSLFRDNSSPICAEDINQDSIPDLVLLGDGKVSVCIQYAGQFLPQDYVEELMNYHIENLAFNSHHDLIFSGNFPGIYSAENINVSGLYGSLFVDINNNGSRDTFEVGIPYQAINIEPANRQIFTTQNGVYGTYLDNGANTFIPPVLPHYTLTTDSTVYSVWNSAIGDSTYIDDFAYFPADTLHALNVQLLGGFPRCNQQTPFWISIHNVGTTTPHGIIELQLDSALTFVSSNPPADSVSGNTVYWTLDTLGLFGTSGIALSVGMPPFQSPGTVLQSTLEIDIYENNTMVASFFDTLEHPVLCAYDPNDKTADPLGLGVEGFIAPETNSIEYTIRFQNTGTDTAFNVRIQDQLDSDFDIQSLEILASSDPVTTTCDPQGLITFNFTEIQLPDSIVNEPRSHGFVRYRIELKDGLPVGTQLRNTAHIYFDVNPPITTNSTLQTLYECPGLVATTNTTNLCFGDTLFSSLPITLGAQCTWDFLSENRTGNDAYWIGDSAGLWPLQLSVSNNLCGNFDTVFLITVYPEQTIQIVDSLTICQGDSVLVYGSQQHVPGTYYSTHVSSTGCDSLVGTLLNVISVPNVTIPPFFTDTLCVDDAPIDLPPGSPIGGVYSGSGITDTLFDPGVVQTGWSEFIYTYINSFGCQSSDTSAIFIDECLSVGHLTWESVKVYPNPSIGGRFKIEFISDMGRYNVRVLTLLGAELWSMYDCEGKIQSILLPNVGRGSYLLEITDVNARMSRLIQID